MKGFQKFEALNNEKKEVIINVAMAEFLKGGYEKASMNALVASAGISKGSLFYYFDNKKTLYLYLFETFQTLICETAERGIAVSEGDFISRVTSNVKENVLLLRKYPLAYAFMKACKNEKSEKVFEAIQALKNKKADNIFSKLYVDIDRSLFKEDIDVEMAIYTSKTMLFQIVHDYLNRQEIHSDQLMTKIDEYADFYKSAFYR